jgi:hypothetical protein
MWQLTVAVLILGIVMAALKLQTKEQTWKPLTTFRYQK